MYLSLLYICHKWPSTYNTIVQVYVHMANVVVSLIHMMATWLYLLRTMSSMNGPYSQTTTWGKLWESRFPLGCWLRWTRFFAGHRRPFLLFLLFVPVPIHVFPICSTNLDVATMLTRKWRITNFIEVIDSSEKLL